MLGIVVLTILFGILYPLLITGVSQVAFPGNANGQQVHVNGKLVGSKIIGQQFTDQVVKNGKPQIDKNGNPITVPDPRYFQTRPSATVPPTTRPAPRSRTPARTTSRPSRRSRPTSRPTCSWKSRMTQV